MQPDHYIHHHVTWTCRINSSAFIELLLKPRQPCGSSFRSHCGTLSCSAWGRSKSLWTRWKSRRRSQPLPGSPLGHVSAVCTARHPAFLQASTKSMKRERWNSSVSCSLFEATSLNFLVRWQFCSWMEFEFCGCFSFLELQPCLEHGLMPIKILQYFDILKRSSWDETINQMELSSPTCDCL